MYQRCPVGPRDPRDRNAISLAISWCARAFRECMQKRRRNACARAVSHEFMNETACALTYVHCTITYYECAHHRACTRMQCRGVLRQKPEDLPVALINLGGSSEPCRTPPPPLRTCLLCNICYMLGFPARVVFFLHT